MECLGKLTTRGDFDRESWVSGLHSNANLRPALEQTHAIGENVLGADWIGGFDANDLP